ncbi:hypothetical protein PR048_014734 [Dryococelus australis]|uniref:Uncharacterized protein n=1 Tax=Dryococelus australis TaxID=614101 RepID=A0ABQ9HF10_9NEOP|nr:hypothetical protein PR048_014734 [Dryococelus australis]
MEEEGGGEEEEEEEEEEENSAELRRRFAPSGLVRRTTTTRLPPRRTRFDYRRGRFLIFACGNRVVRCHWSAGSLGDLQFPPPSCIPAQLHIPSLHHHRLLRPRCYEPPTSLHFTPLVFVEYTPENKFSDRHDQKCSAAVHGFLLNFPLLPELSLVGAPRYDALTGPADQKLLY